MTHKEMVEISRAWLYDHGKCFVVICEPKCSGEQPDAIGWDSGGFSTLIECKTSKQDLVRDEEKEHRIRPIQMGHSRYFMLPRALAGQIGIAHRDGWGTLVVEDDGAVSVWHKAPDNFGRGMASVRAEMRLLVNVLSNKSQRTGAPNMVAIGQ